MDGKSPSLSSTHPFLNLPVELHRDIVDYLDFPDKACLRLTSRYFRDIIKRPSLEELREVESLPWATSKGIFACSLCNRLRPLLAFSDDMRKGRRGRGGPEARLRFCVHCGVTGGGYKPGTELTIMGKRYVICGNCHSYTDRVGARGACSSCRPLSASALGSGNNANSDFASGTCDIENLWASSARSDGGCKRSEDIYGLCSHF